MDGVFDLELGLELRSASINGGGCGDLEGREVCDICEGERDAGKEESEVLRFGQGPLAFTWGTFRGALLEIGSTVWAEAIISCC